MANPFIERFIEQIKKSTRRLQSHEDSRAQKQTRIQSVDRLNIQEMSLNTIDDTTRIDNRINEYVKAIGRPAIPAENLDRERRVLLERIINTNDLLGVRFFKIGAAKCDTVGRIVIKYRGQVLGHGTGFLISPNLIMTNNHVLSSSEEAADSLIQFDYFAKSDGQLSIPKVYQLDPGTFFQTDEELDYSIVALNLTSQQQMEVESRGWNPLIPASGKMIVGERVNIIQHPGGEPQQVAFRQNRIQDVVGDFLHYETDTERGSSGSPVLNDQWQLGALHHAGVPKKVNGRIYTIDNQPWDGRSETIHKIAWVANEGARISRIVTDLKNRSLDSQQRAMFEATLSKPPENAVPSGNQTESNPTPPSQNSPTIRDGRIHFQIPIEVSIGVPGFDGKGHSSQAAVPPSSGASQQTSAPNFSPSQPVQDTQEDELSSFLEKHRQAVSKPYYDRESDARDLEQYYQGIAEDNDLVGIPLFRRLHQLVKDTHTRVLSYRSARLDHLYPNVDLQPNGNLKSIYSGKEENASEVIRREFLLEERARREVRKKLNMESLSEDQYEAEIDRLESSGGFNCEHVACQSWFNKRQPMKADLHHLFSCDPRCNSFRSNIPYYQFSPEDEKEMHDCGRREKGVNDAPKFEPVGGKGSAARATLYFLIRYPGQIGDEARELQRNRLDVLLDWHQQYPVGTYELHRNAEIYAVQGNRNPLIDFPNWAEFIDFSEGFG